MPTGEFQFVSPFGGTQLRLPAKHGFDYRVQALQPLTVRSAKWSA